MAVNLSDAAVTQSSIFIGSAKFLSGAAVAGGLAANTATDLFSTESGTNASIVDTLSGIENVTTGIGQDYVVGSSATNVIIAGNGIDWISAGDGADYVSADAAGDGGDIDRVIGGTGDDTYVYSDAGAADIYIEAASSGYDTILVNGDLSIATLTVGTTATAAGAVGSLSNFEQIVIGTDNTATVLGAQVTGLPLNVTEVAAGTSALVVTATVGGTTDLSKLTFSAGTYIGAAGTVLAGNALTSGTDLVTINGGTGTETIIAASIGTIVIGGALIDTITLGAGTDTVQLTSADTNDRDVISSFGATDIIAFDESAFATVDFGATAAVAGLAAADYNEIAATGTIEANHVNVITTAAGYANYAAAIAAVTAAAANTDGFVVFYNSTSTKTEIYWDADMDDGDSGVLIAQIDITGANLAAALSNANFATF